MPLKKYEQKELAVYQAIETLFQAGEDLLTLKAAQIAAAAGIGKGTLYNYFDTKEEMVAKGVVYLLENQVTALYKEVQETVGFREKWMCIFAYITHAVRNRRSILHLAMFGDLRTLLKKHCPCPTASDDMYVLFEEGIQTLLACGEKEGVVQACADQAYVRLVIMGVVMGFSTALFTEASADTAAEQAYTLLLKGLN